MVQFSVLVSEEEAVAVEVAKLIKEEIEELAVEAVAVVWAALQVMVDKVVPLEEDMDLVVDNQVEQEVKPLVEVEVAVVIMVIRHMVELVDQVVKHLVMQVVVKIEIHQVVMEEQMGLPLDGFRVITVSYTHLRAHETN